MLKIYGLKNCDTCRKALKWLDEEGIAFEFLDVRKDGITEADVKIWSKAVGVDSLLNRRGTTWRGLSDADKARGEGAGAVALMVQFPALIKRPVFVQGDQVMVGYTDAVKDRLR
ncbi:MAG: arsenate reductase [Rhodospirillales bacterium]|nr:arsenate reductase [Rhodospirillales bacterium]